MSTEQKDLKKNVAAEENIVEENAKKAASTVASKLAKISAAKDDGELESTVSKAEEKEKSTASTASSSKESSRTATSGSSSGFIAWAKSNKGKMILGVIALFIIYVLYQLKYVYEVWFDPDELDIYTVAFEMVKGKVLYRDIASQHMPFTYIYSTIFYWLGAHEVWLQRIYYYILFAFFWTMFVIRYNKYVNKWALVLHPFLFYTYMQLQDFSTQILSENIVAIGAEIFVLEFIRFLKEKDIDTKGCILMAVAVMFTFGTTFIAIFPLFFVGLGVLLLEIKWRIERGQSRKDWWQMMLKRYGKLFGITLIPWLGFLIYGAATHSLGDFYVDAYLINRLYYPKYNDGVGGSVGGTFLTPFMSLANEFFGINMSAIEPTFVLRWIGIIAGGLYFPYKLARKYGWIAGFTMFVYTFSYGTRGYFNYHGKGFVAVISMMTMITLVQNAYNSKESFDKANIARKAFLATTVMLIFANNTYNLNNMFTILVNSEYNHYQYDTDYMQKITDEDERIWMTNMCDAIPWAAKKVTTGAPVSCPWMWEGVGAPMFEEFSKNPPRVIMFQLGYESWGHKMADYAPDAYYFIVNNYKYLPDSGQIWVLNSYYDEACRKVGIDPETYPNDNGLGVTPYTVDPSEMPGMTAEDRARYREALANGGAPAEVKTEETTTEEVTTEEQTTEATTEATTEEINVDDDAEDSDALIVTPDSNDNNDIIDDTTGPGSTSSGNGPGDVNVSPADERGGSNSDVNGDTPGAVQAPDGSWVIPDDSDGPGM